MKAHNLLVTGSLTAGNGEAISSISSSVATTTLSLGSRITTIEGKSLVSGSSQVDVMSTTNIARLATTGSNIFQGTQTINGSLVVTGSLTAQQFIVSSSVTYMTTSYASGSTRFGDTSDDTMQVTGSVYVTSNSAGVTAGDFITDVTNKYVYVGRQSTTSGDNTTFIVRDRTGVARATIPGGGSTDIVFVNNASNFKVTNYGGTSLFTVDNTGNGYISGNTGLGIGANGSIRLQVQGSSTVGTVGTETALLLARDLTSGVSFQQAAAFKLGRYATAGGIYESRTRLDIALKSDSAVSDYSTDVTVMTLTNQGYVGINNVLPGTNLDVNGSVGHNNGGTYKSIEFFRTVSASTSAANLYTVTIGSSNTAVFYEIIVFGGDWSNHSAARTIKRGFFAPNGGYTPHSVVESAGVYAANITLGYTQSTNAFTTTLTLDQGSVTLLCHIRIVGDISSYS